MGIQGLIPFLEKATRQVNIRQYSGCCVAVDAYCWLHKGAFSCAEKLARGEKCDAYVFYCMKFVNMLLSHNIKPILVFDGRHLPAKADVESKRRESRENCRTRAAQLLRAGRTDEARNFIRRCVDVTHEMALTLIQECQKRNVDCIVAPYEADAQLAYLNINNIAQIVITEDSDLVLFGCTKIMFKMDVNGNGLLVEQEKLFLSMGVRPENFSFDKFRYMCILSGCDYLPSLPGVGLNKACKFVKKITEPDIHKALLRLPAYLNLKSVTVTEDYRDSFMLADSAFRYQLVFDPVSRKLVHLTNPPQDYEHDDFAGRRLPDDVAFQLALGNLEPFTLKKVANFDPDKVVHHHQRTESWKQATVAPHASIWSRNYKRKSPTPPLSPVSEVRKVDHSNNRSKVATVKVTLLPTPKKKPVTILDELCKEEDLLCMYGNPAGMKRPHAEEDDGDVKSPELGTKKRNPFAKKIESDNSSPDVSRSLFDIISVNSSPVKSSNFSPVKENASPDTVEPKVFSALKKFGQFQRTSLHGKNLVQSRYFSKKDVEPTRPERRDEERRSPPLQDCAAMLKDVSNALNISDASEETDQMLLDDDEFFERESTSSSSVSCPSRPFNRESAMNHTLKDEGSFCSQSTAGGGGVFKWGNFQNKFSCKSRQAADSILLKSSASACREFKNPSQKTEASSDVTDVDSDIISSSDSGFHSDPLNSSSSSIGMVDDGVHVTDEVLSSPPPAPSLRTPPVHVARVAGLKKKLKTENKQQTLLNMFGFQKKPKLLHT